MAHGRATRIRRNETLPIDEPCVSQEGATAWLLDLALLIAFVLLCTAAALAPLFFGVMG